MMDGKYMIVFALLLLPSVFALGPHGKDVKAERLGAAMDNVECKAQFMVGVLDSMMEHVNGTENLQNKVDVINSDINQMQDYVNDADGKSFWTYVKEDYIPHMREARQAVVQARKDANLSFEERATLRDDYDALKSEYDSCNFESAKKFGEAKVEAYELILERAENKTDKLKDKGVETSDLSQLVDEARSDVVEPLQNALEDADTGLEIRTALRSYCLFNGCPRGSNFHFAARFETKKLGDVLDAISDDATDAGLESEVETATGYVGDAQEVLDTVGSEQYNSEQSNEIWDNIHSAINTVRSILSELRSS